jgi:hypothetical protein
MLATVQPRNVAACRGELVVVISGCPDSVECFILNLMICSDAFDSSSRVPASCAGASIGDLQVVSSGVSAVSPRPAARGPVYGCLVRCRPAGWVVGSRGPPAGRGAAAQGGVSESRDAAVVLVRPEWRCSSGRLRRSSCRARGVQLRWRVTSALPSPGRRPTGESVQRVPPAGSWQWQAGGLAEDLEQRAGSGAALSGCVLSRWLAGEPVQRMPRRARGCSGPGVG